MPKPCWITPQETGTAVICPSGSLLTGVSSCFSDFPKNISVFTHPKSILELFPSRPTEGRFAIVTNVGHGMRWTRQDASTLASSLAEARSAQPGWTKPSIRRATVAKEPFRRGARRKPLKPLRAGTSGDSGVLVVARVRSTTTKCTRGRGCQGHPAFPTPSLGVRFINGSGALRGEIANACVLDVIASAAKQSISRRKGRMDCFASLAMTVRQSKRCWLFEN